MSQRASSAHTALAFRRMTDADIPFGMHLKTQAGWNQTQADWQRLLALAPDGCFLAEVDGQPAGTAVAVTFGPVAWIGMVLVDANQRGKGIGTALMRHLLDHLDARHIPTVRLDATHLGEPIYRKLGFQAQFPLIRLHRTPAPPTPERSEAKLRITTNPALDTLAALDHETTHTDRRPLLARLLEEQPNHACLAECDGQPLGYLLMRPGSHATQIGPAIANDTDTACALLDHALRQLGDSPSFIDVPADHTAVLDHLAAQGFTEQRRFTRMTRGTLIHEHVPTLIASSGPEKG